MSDFDTEMNTPERKEFERWYAVNAFDYATNPIGSRECGLQWAAWKACAALAKPVVAPEDWEGVAADQAMTIAMLKVDYQQLQDLVTSQGVRMMEQEEWQKDAARYYWLRDSSHWPAKFGDNGDFAPLSGAELDAAIDAAMQGEKP